MKNLVIVESPSKSKTIEKYLGKDFEVVSSKGHIRELSKSGKGKLGVDVDDHFKAKYTISKDKKDVVKELKAKAKKVDNVFLATDPDREGEAISWHLAQELKLDIDQPNRVVFNEITKDAVLKAFVNPRKIDINLVKSQEARRILDRIIGFKLSSLLQNKIKSKSAGRVQSVALKLIVDKEKEIKAFVPVEYWKIVATFVDDSVECEANLTKFNNKKIEIENEEKALEVLNNCKGKFEVSNIKKQTKSKKSKVPFITSTLQQEASTKLGFNAKRTMMTAQKLYEGIKLKKETEGLITYMRTDSTRLSETFINAAREKIENDFGKKYLGHYKESNNQNSQDAHEAIRPTNLENTPESVEKYLNADQFKLYKFIYTRALASLMADAKNDTVAITFSQNNYDFVANGNQLVFDGYLKIYSDYETSKDVTLPYFEEKQKLDAKEVTKSQHFTEPPMRYTEAKLIKQLETEGIGRPSTYSMIIDTIQYRGYVTLDNSTETSKTKVFFPSEQGILTSEKLEQFFNDIINVKYTANMENKLDAIALGNENNVDALDEFYKRFMPLVDNAYEKMEKIEPLKTGEKCPQCNEDLVYRVGRFGKFISCSNFPECKYTEKIEKENKVKAEPSGKMCPECGSELLKRKSRFGNFFLGCSNFPKCRHIENIEGESRFPKKKKKESEDE
ncbi:MAG: type I DNA topoisomerase [Anaerorhabdus sp.]